MSRANTLELVGKASIYHGPDGKYAFPDLMMRIKNKADIIQSDFLLHCIQSSSARKYIEQHATGTNSSMKKINQVIIEKLPIPSFSIKRQRAIVSVFASWTSAIEKTEQLIAAKKQRMRSLMNALILRPSNHWKSYSLSDVCAPVVRKNTVGETNVLTSSAEYGLISQLEYYKKSVSASDVTGYYLLHKGEFAYNRSAAKRYPYGAIKRLETYTQGVLSTLYLCFSVSSETVCDPVFLAHYFESGVLNRALSAVCQEGARSHGLLNITKADFFDLPIALPSIDSQKKIAEGISVAAEEIELLVKQRNLYEKQKSFLMSKLLSGEWEAPASAFEEVVE